MYRNRDMGINYIKARHEHRCYGMGLGIIILDDVYPGFPGDVRNASAYPFPIQYEIAEGVDILALVHGEDKTPCLEPIQRAAKKLERMGCRAIAAECGADALTHAIEAFVALNANPLTDPLAATAIKLIGLNLRQMTANPGNRQAAENMLLASCLAGQAMASAGLGLVLDEHKFFNPNNAFIDELSIDIAGQLTR